MGENTLAELMVQLMKETAFNTLRTNEQLGKPFILISTKFFTILIISHFESNVLNSDFSRISHWRLFLNYWFLGYIIWTSSRMHNGTLGLDVIVQGPKDPDHVIGRIENFIETFQVNIDRDFS